MTYAEMTDDLLGYQPHFNAVDSETARECGCETCHSKNVRYLGRARGDSYRAFIICNDCGECLEF